MPPLNARAVLVLFGSILVGVTVDTIVGAGGIGVAAVLAYVHAGDRCAD